MRHLPVFSAFAYSWMCVCMCACVYVWACACVGWWVRACVRACMRACVRACVRACAFLYVCMHACMSAGVLEKGICCGKVWLVSFCKCTIGLDQICLRIFPHIFVRQFIYGILSDKGNIGMKPAYNSNILKKIRTKHSYYGQMRSDVFYSSSIVFIHISLGQSPQTYGLLTGYPSQSRIAIRNWLGEAARRTDAWTEFQPSAAK